MARKARVSFVLADPREGNACHIRQVNAVKAHARGVFTASSDASLRQWSPKLECMKVFDDHAHWVNGVAVVGDKLLSCSSDMTVKVWALEGDQQQAVCTTLHGHTDYVQCVAVAAASNVAVSGGLDMRVHLWDLNNLASEEVAKGSLEERTGSIYSVHINQEGTTLVTGASDNVVRVYDCRSGKRVMKLRGHSDNVRSVCLSPDCTKIVSASSDGTVRVWDVGHQSCASTIRCHTDSVRSVVANDAFTRVVSASRDKTIRLTSLRTLSSVCVGVMEDSVCALDAFGDFGRVCAGTASGGLGIFSLGASEEEVARQESAAPPHEARRALSFSGSPHMRPVQEEPVVPIEHTPECAVQGGPFVKRCAVLADKQRVLAQRSDGVYEVWNVCSGEREEEVEGEFDSFDRAVAHVDRKCSVPSWFSVDNKTGRVAVRLERNNAFSALAYASDTPLCGKQGEKGNPDQKVNLGEATVRGLFRLLERAPNGDDGGQPPKKAEHVRPKFELPQDTVIVVCHGDTGQVLARTTVAKCNDARQFLPVWLVDVLESQAPALPKDKEPKTSFQLLPSDQDGLPELESGDELLCAVSILTMAKVASHVRSKIENPEGKDQTPQFEILCKGKVVEPWMSLAAVRQFLWREPKDLVLVYRPVSEKAEDKEDPPPESAPKEAEGAEGGEAQPNKPRGKHKKKRKQEEAQANE